MTTEEAIKKIEHAKLDFLEEYVDYSGLAEAYDLAIAALERDRWISVKSRPMDEEERKEWSEKFGYELTDDEAVIFVSQLPDDGQEVLVYHRYGNITIDKFSDDPDYGVSFEENGDMDGIVAWMPLPDTEGLK